MARKYMGVRFQGKMYRFSVFDFEDLLKELPGGFLPTNFFAYHFEEGSRKHKDYMKIEPLKHPDGNHLGAFRHELVLTPTLRDGNGTVYQLVDERWQPIE